MVTSFVREQEKEWAGEDRKCKLCLDVGSLKHIWPGYESSLTQGHYMWRHNEVTKTFACLFENE